MFNSIASTTTRKLGKTILRQQQQQHGRDNALVKLFSPSQHMWLTAEPTTASFQPQIPSSSSSVSSDQNLFLVKFGLTERGYEEIGDIESITPTRLEFFNHNHSNDSNNNNNNNHNTLEKSQQQQQKRHNDAVIVNRGEEVMKISWHGHSITRADELYHTVWETLEDDFVVRAPMRGTLLEVATEQCWEQFGTDTWLAQLLVRPEAAREEEDNDNDDDDWMEEEEYDQRVKELPRGAFADD